MTERINENIEKNEIGFQSKEVAKILEGIGEDFGFDKETCSEIASLPLIDAIEMAYSYLVQAGFDPEEVLSDFIEISESSDEI